MFGNGLTDWILIITMHMHQQMQIIEFMTQQVLHIIMYDHYIQHLINILQKHYEQQNDDSCQVLHDEQIQHIIVIMNGSIVVLVWRALVRIGVLRRGRGSLWCVWILLLLIVMLLSVPAWCSCKRSIKREILFRV